MNIIYLYLHEILLHHAGTTRLLPRKRVEYIISRYLGFVPVFVRQNALKEMRKAKLLRRVNRDTIEVLKVDKKKYKLDPGVLLKIMQAGSKK